MKKQAQIIVGIGASAGGLEALQALISGCPRSIPNTAIIIAQHLSPDYKSMLVELLSRKTSIPVEHIENGMLIEENHIYIAPPSDDVAVKNNAFYLKKPASVGAHPSVDVLFASLAKEYGNKACGIVLSGTGKDGSRGIVAIHKVGGTTVAQEPSTAKYEGMPIAARNTGAVDQVLPPEKIGEQLLELVTHSRSRAEEIKDHAVQSTETFPQIFELLEHRIGIDFREYKTSTLIRRLNKRIHERRFDNEEEYLEYIREHPDELDRLFEALLIGVTTFFRDPEAFEKLEAVFQQITADKKPGGILRIWIPGCATGEEAYTIAIIICEFLQATKQKVSLQLFATDIDMRALQKARIGIYAAQTVKNVPPSILVKYFKKINENTYEVHKDIRKLVLFSRHDVTANPPFLRLDLISCRNLLIYFSVELQKKVFPLFYYALNPQGFLLLGKSENIGKFHNLFSTFNPTYKIFQRKSVDGKLVRFPHLRPSRSERIMPPHTVSPREDLTISEMVKETLFNNYGHPFVVVDESMDIMEINGEISPFLEFKPGSASLNVMKLVTAPLQIELRTVTGKAVTTMKSTTGSIRKIGSKDRSRYVRITVKPLLYTQPNNPYFLIIFEDLELDQKFLKMGTKVMEGQESPRVIELEQELEATKEHTNSLLEELETSNEELQALNEEMQASNEELQASNEELETSNEELQATNEELENAYSELREANSQIEQHKKELERSANNLTTLLNNTLVGFILIDREYKVLAANKTARTMYKKLLNVKLKEGVSFIKLLPDAVFATFHQNFKKALTGKQAVTEESVEGHGSVQYFDFNYTPVLKDKKEKEARMVAVSFVDITQRKQAELDLMITNKELAEEKQFMHTLTESLPSFVWTTDSNGRYLYCNSYFLNYIGSTFEDIRASGWQPFIHPDDWENTHSLWVASLNKGSNFSIEHRIKHHSGEYRWYLTLAEVIRTDRKSGWMWVGSSTEIESLKKRQEMEKDVQHLKQQHNELVHLNKIKDEFISLASHQLRTPATAVKQYLAIVMNEYAGPITADQLQYLQTAYNSNERQLTVINDLLKTAQLDTNDYAINKGQHDVGDLVHKIAEELQPMFDLKQQKTVITCSSPVSASFDYEEIKLVLTNLLENASKYSYPGTPIKVTVRAKETTVEISVKDQGVGIRQEDQEQIFEKFTRISNDLSDTVSGSGLGLYWVKRIVNLHNGKIRVTSQPNKGATFTVRLPL